MSSTGSSVASASNAVDPSRILHTGWVFKQGGSWKTWKKRYFVLYPDRIKYLESPNDAVPKGTIDLRTASGAQLVGFNATGRQHSFMITTRNRKWMVACETPDAPAQWVQFINAALNELGVSVQVPDNSNASSSIGSSLLSSAQTYASSSLSSAVGSISSSVASAANKLSVPSVSSVVSSSISAGVSALSKMMGKVGVHDPRVYERRLQSQNRRKEEVKRQLEETRRAHEARVEAHRAESIQSLDQYGETCLKALKNGIVFTKYPFSGSAPHDRFLLVSKNGSLIQTGKSAKNITKNFAVDDIRYVVYGPFSNVFKTKFPRVEGHCRCISLIIGGSDTRSLDIQAKSDEDCNTLFFGFQHLLRQSILESNRPILNRAQFFAKRLYLRLREKRSSLREIISSTIKSISPSEPENFSALRDLFDEFDESRHVEKISREDFLQFCQTLFVHPVIDPIFDSLWREVDLADDQMIGFNQFRKLVEALFDINEFVQLAVLRREFFRRDDDESDSLSVSTLFDALAVFGMTDISGEDRALFLKLANVSDHERISWEQFMQAARFALPTFINRFPQLCHPSLMDAKRVFYEFDETQDGFISFDSCVKFLSLLGFEFSNNLDQVRSIWNEIDDKKVNLISFNDFLRFSEALLGIEEICVISHVRNLFLLMDPKRAGFVNLDDVERMVILLNHMASEGTIYNVLKPLRSCKDSLVPWSDFLSSLLKQSVDMKLFIFNPRHEREFSNLFDLFDVECSGTLGRGDVEKFLRMLGSRYDPRLFDLAYDELALQLSGFEGRLSLLQFLQFIGRVFDRRKLALISRFRRLFNSSVSEQSREAIPLTALEQLVRSFQGRSFDPENFLKFSDVVAALATSSRLVIWDDLVSKAIQYLPEFHV